MRVYDLKFSDAFMHPVMDNGVSKVVQFSFPKEKELKKHKTTSDIVVLVLEGKILFTANEEVILEKGQLLSLEKNIEHSIVALEDSIVLLILTPSPAAHSIFKPQAQAEQKSEDCPAPMEQTLSTKKAVSPQLWSFVEEHAELLEILNHARKGFDLGVYESADSMISEELGKHFRYEEDILFPLLGKYIGTNVGPIAVMLSEHKIIRDNHQTFHTQLSAFKQNSCSQADVEQAFLPLESVLRAHIIKEDNVLFPMASSVMSEQDKDEVAQRVKEQEQ